MCSGGPADHANNWPLRGSKGSDCECSSCSRLCVFFLPFSSELFWPTQSNGCAVEGGTRVCAFLNGGYLKPSLRGSKIEGMMHITDWWATLSTLVGQSVDDPKANLAGLPPPDSIDVK